MADAFVIGIGGSSGSQRPLTTILEALPRDLPAAVLVVVHRHRTSDSYLAQILERQSKLKVVQATDDTILKAGGVYVAPPDRHLLVVGDRLRLSSGPRENHSRPAIDVLFRSMALHCGPRAIGILLSGLLNDGVDGLRAVGERGGTTVVQDPADADYREMPDLALEAFDPHHLLPAHAIAETVLQVLGARARTAPAAPPSARLRTEVAMALGDRLRIATEEGLGERSNVTCPDCGGVLWLVSDEAPVRYRCHTGHAFTEHALAEGQRQKVEEALWIAMRALRERAETLRGLARRAGRQADRERWAVRAAEVDAQANALADGLVVMGTTPQQK